MGLENRITRTYTGYNHQPIVVGRDLLCKHGRNLSLYIELRTHIRKQILVVDRALVLQRPFKIVILAHSLNHYLIKVNVQRLDALCVKLLNQKPHHLVMGAGATAFIPGNMDKALELHNGKHAWYNRRVYKEMKNIQTYEDLRNRIKNI